MQILKFLYNFSRYESSINTSVEKGGCILINDLTITEK